MTSSARTRYATPEYAKLLTDSRYREHLAFWRAQLEPLDGAFHLRQNWHAYALPEVTEEAGKERHEILIALDTAKHGFVADWFAGNELAAFVILLGAIKQALSLYSGAATVCVDSPLLRAASRSDFAATIPLVGVVESSLTVQSYVDRIRNAVAQSYSYQDFPVAAAWETVLQRDGELTTNVLVWSAAIHDLPEDVGKYDLLAEIRLTPKLHLALAGKATVFAKAFVENFGRHTANLLAGYRDLQRPLGDLSAIDEEERLRLLHTHNQTQRALPVYQGVGQSVGQSVGQTIAELFTARAAASPDACALKAAGRTMSYGELNEASNRLAWFLKDELGIRPGDVVGLCVERSELAIIGLLATLKAGAVYLPIDVEYPTERLAFLLDDAKVRALLMHSEQLARLLEFSATAMVALDLQLPTLTTSTANLPPLAAADAPAYIIYTSGSTGKPKGVVVEHRSFVNTALHHIEAFDVTAADCLSQFYAPSFDSSLFEIFVALLSGASLVLIDKATISDAEAFARHIEAEGVTMLTIPPVYLATLERARLGAVKKIVSAGDNPRLADAIALAQTRDYYNSYGPTETSVCVTHYRLNPAVGYGARLPIGKPISNVTLYVLDEQMRLTPEGCIGEICVGGAALARGYLNRDELTAQAFVANPFVQGERLYRTGDLGIRLPDGNLEMVGRKDAQVKIRGYRIELGEVELALASHANVKEAVALAREDKPGDKRLVAYVTLARPTTNAELREHLRSRLPEFMLPSAFAVLAAMPVTANGKIDRKQLPAPHSATETSQPKAPQSEAQSQLVEIWQEVLGVASLGIDDNFFELGGDSILIIQMVSQAARRGLRFTPQRVFEHQTIAALAEVVESGVSADAEQQAISGAALMLPMQQWFFAQALEERHHYNQSVLLAVPADIEPQYLRVCVQSLLAHHDALRARFTCADGHWAQEIADVTSEPVPFDVVDLSSVEAIERQAALAAAAAELQASLNLAQGGLLRARLFRLDGEEARLLLVIHHLVVDGVSWRVLLEDLYYAYQQQRRGEAVALPPKTTSAREWARRLAQHAGDIRGDEIAYWMDEARRQARRLPTDYADAANTLDSAETVELALDEGETQALLQEAPRAYNTQINDILLTALALTVKEWTGEATLLVDLEAHGREELFQDLNLLRTVGWLTAVYPAMLRVEGASPGETLVAVKEQLRRVPRHGIGYGVLRYLGDAAPCAALAALPQAEVVFNYLGQTDRVLTMGSEWRAIPGANGGERTSKGRRSHALEITGIINGGRLQLAWEYSRNLHRRQTIERLACRCLEHLRALIAHCAAADGRGYTPSDFPAARLDQKTLDALMSRFGRE